MTDLKPYAKYSDVAVVLAIAQSKTPTDFSVISLPDFAVELLEACWRQSPRDRPTMTWCKDVLYQMTSALFVMYTKGSLADIPDDRKKESENWHAIFNPAIKAQYEIEFLATFDNVTTKYVRALPPKHFPVPQAMFDNARPL